jgi:UDP-glucose:glycoprotein glucosyltransferase
LNCIFNSAFTIGNNETALFHVAALLEPLSEVGRRYANLIQVSIFYVDIESTPQLCEQWLSGIEGTHINIHLSPLAYAQVIYGFPRENIVTDRNQIPLKSFYRYNLLTEIRFNEAG